MKKIFIVDDDNYKIQNIQALLFSVNEKYSITISHALNPALKKLYDEDFDLILLDMSMPVFDLSETRNFDSLAALHFFVK